MTLNPNSGAIQSKQHDQQAREEAKPIGCRRRGALYPLKKLQEINQEGERLFDHVIL